MDDIEKKGKKEKKQGRPVKHGQHSQPTAAGVPASGGSRQGNIGHQGTDSSDNSHR